MEHTPENGQPSKDSIERGHEVSDINARSVFISGLIVSIGLTVVGLAIAAGVYSFYKSTSNVRDASARSIVIPDSTQLPPQPRLQSDPHVSLVPFVLGQDSVLASYGWISKDSGLVRIPIDRAMKLVVQRGLAVESKEK